MKFCSKCGKELFDEAVICTGCGCAVEGAVGVQNKAQKSDASGLKLATKILMIIGAVASGWMLIPLAWTIPMTVSYCKKIKNNEPVTTGFKVCSLLFVSLVGGILMLCDNE